MNRNLIESTFLSARWPLAGTSTCLFLVGLLLVVGTPQPARATVFATGNVTPADDPFTIGVNEGLPVDGNFIDPFADPPDVQPNFEGLEDIIVGERSFGSLLISGESALRYQSLVAGHIGIVGDDEMRVGTGVIRIEGFGSLYNNDPEVLPGNLTPADITILRDTGLGYDLLIGTFGTGTVNINNGARAEIQDAVVIGMEAGSVGDLVVDGFDSYLESGGFGQFTDGSTGGGVIPNPQGVFSVGLFGTGRLYITNGGTVRTRVAEEATAADAIAAVLGGRPTQGDQTVREGGSGEATVDGIGSSWILSGGLQVGAFHDARDAETGDDLDFEGNDVLYNSDVGDGTLYVKNNALVQINDLVPPGSPVSGAFETQLLVGRFGRVHLETGGRINIGGVGIDSGRTDDVRLINDGLITGHGRIDTGVFFNRLFGEVRVGAGEKLLLTSSSEFEAGDLTPLNNFGLIEVIGGEVEFERTQVPDPSDELAAVFVNHRLPTPPPAIGRETGLIVGDNATLRFRPGLLNSGRMAFVAGDNIVTGDVVNDDESMPGLLDDGVIIIAGEETFVTFEDDLVNMGVIDIAPEATGFTVLGDFAMMGVAAGGGAGLGELRMALGGGESGLEFSHVTVGDDALLAGTLSVDLVSTGGAPLAPMGGEQFEILSAAGSLAGDFTTFNLPFLGPGLGWVPDPIRTDSTYVLAVQSAAAAIGADFDADGIVDADDFRIWLANLGNPGGLGDANMDGIVDGLDFLIWQMQLGGPGMGAGAGAALGAAVPEPASGWLLLAAALFVPWSRRRQR